MPYVRIVDGARRARHSDLVAQLRLERRLSADRAEVVDRIERDELGIDRHHAQGRIWRGLARRHLAEREHHHHALAAALEPRAESRKVGELANPPALR